MPFFSPEEAVDRLKVESVRRVRAQIAKRVEKYCTNLSSDEFEALVDQMAGIQCKYEGARGLASVHTDVSTESSDIS
jgi:hypothetical protein